MPTRCLIAYATREGQTEKIALFMADEIRKKSIEVDTINLRSGPVSLSHYDVIIFGASIHIGGLEKEFVKFVEDNKDIIEQKNSHLFAVCLASATTDPKVRSQSENEIYEILNKLPVKFSSRELFAGALKYTQYNWFIRMIMKRIAKKSGGSTDTSQDHEYTNWDKVKEYINTVVRP